ncbi:hypothetical protein [Aeromicrobium sp. 9AM]|uniref:DUF3885 domain-containing protein n=1 Tax=Aeromicrobium sp. 9AM TaxID=2653126 RepID=UPI0012F430F8|nr:hypothetical protein [Aeromicrobium sp. 9AM]VXB44149.1 conserved hypothetical protein [Aeromicrobium sp. 9AM]
MRFWSFWNGHVRPWLDRLPPHIHMAPELAWLTNKWEAKFPGVLPIGHLVRDDERWVRFHSLPESKRYAENESEYEELLRRHHEVLTTLSAPHTDLIAITASWSPTKYARSRSRALQRAAPRAELWQSVVVDPDDEDAWFTNLFVSRVENSPASLNPLLRLVADFGTSDVLLTTPELTWLYHPYDGGADVIASSVERRDLIRQEFADWLPSNSSGL